MTRNKILMSHCTSDGSFVLSQGATSFLLLGTKHNFYIINQDDIYNLEGLTDSASFLGATVQ